MIPPRAAEIRKGLDEACEAADRDPTTLPLSAMTGWVVCADGDDLRERASRLAPWEGETDGDSYLAGLPDSWISGTVPEALKQLHELEQVG